jgi:hypothetical protein
MFVFEGEVADAPRVTADDKTGEVKASVNLAFFGGSQYIRLADVSQAKRLSRGSWVRVECGVRAFKDNCYAGSGTITHIDGKPFAPGQAA